MKTSEISWYNFTHPNQDAIEKRDKFLEEPINDCINCAHFYFNNDGSAGCDTPYEYTCLKLKHKFFELIAQKTGEEYLKTVKEKIQHYGKLEK